MLAVLMECCYGWRNLFEKNVRRLVLTVVNFIVVKGKIQIKLTRSVSCPSMIYLYICTTSCIGIRLPSFCYVIFVPTIDRRIRPTKWLLSLWRQCLCEQNIHICPLPKNFFWPRMHTIITNHKYKLTLNVPLVF